MEINNPQQLTRHIPDGESQQIVIYHTVSDAARIDLSLGRDASLSLVEIFTAEAFVECHIRQEAGSNCRVTVVELSSANVNYTVDLDGRGAENTLHGLFMATEQEHCVVRLRMNHNQPDGRSSSFVKGVVAGCARGEFHGLVYVAPDAQRTDARQQSRNIELSSTAHIIVKPQLEIYADDVKCSHGATVGQMDSEAILYMRQRGLDEMQARRLQIEGFVGDVVQHCAVESLCGSLMEQVVAKLAKL